MPEAYLNSRHLNALVWSAVNVLDAMQAPQSAHPKSCRNQRSWEQLGKWAPKVTWIPADAPVPLTGMCCRPPWLSLCSSFSIQWQFCYCKPTKILLLRVVWTRCGPDNGIKRSTPQFPWSFFTTVSPSFTCASSLCRLTLLCRNSRHAFDHSSNNHYIDALRDPLSYLILTKYMPGAPPSEETNQSTCSSPQSARQQC